LIEAPGSCLQEQKLPNTIFAKPNAKLRKELNPKEFVSGITDFLKQLMPPKFTIKVSCESERPFVANPDEIGQIFINLMKNAGQAMEDQEAGMITVAVEEADLSEENNELGLESGPYLKFSISDNGPGMDAGTQAKIFERW